MDKNLRGGSMKSKHGDDKIVWKVVTPNHPKYPRTVYWRGKEYYLSVSVPDSDYFKLTWPGRKDIRLDKSMVLKTIWRR